MVTLPTKGSGDWDVPLNAALTDLQSQVDTKMPTSGGTFTGAVTGVSFNTDGTVRSAFFKTTSTTEHTLTTYAAGTSGTGVALNVINDRTGDSAAYFTGAPTGRGVIKIAHLNGSGSASGDGSAAALSIDLQWLDQFGGNAGGTAAQGIFLTATNGPTTGNLLSFRNAASPVVEEFCVRGSGLSGFQLPVGNTPQGTVEIRQKDVNTTAQVVQGIASSAVPIAQFKNSGGTATFEVGASGALVTRGTLFATSPFQLGSTSSDFGGSSGAVISMKNATTAPTTNPTGGVITYAESGVWKTRDASGNVVNLTKQTVTGSRGGNAALASLLTGLAGMGLITDSTTA